MDQRPDHRVGIQRMADLQPFRLVGKDGGEIIMHRRLDEDTARRGAALAIQRIDHEGSGIGGALEVGIGKDHHRVLAAKFEMHALQRVRPLLHDQLAGGALADKGDGLDHRMFGQGAAGFLAKPVHEVPDAGWQAGLGRDLHQDARRHRRKFCRLVNHRASGSQRRRDLPCRQHERRVPRRDHTDRSDRAT